MIQTKIFFELFKNHNIPVVGIAKRYETLVFPKLTNNKIKFIQYKIPIGPVLNLIQRIRNEAHRFALAYHHKLFKENILDKVDKRVKIE